MSLVKAVEGDRILTAATVDKVPKIIFESKQALPVVDSEGQIRGGACNAGSSQQKNKPQAACVGVCVSISK
jgi:hypothetical protein